MKNKRVVYKKHLKDEVQILKGVQYQELNFNLDSVPWGLFEPNSVSGFKSLFSKINGNTLYNSLLNPLNTLRDIKINTILLKSDLSGFYVSASDPVNLDDVQAKIKNTIYSNIIEKVGMPDFELIQDKNCCDMLMNKVQKKGLLDKLKSSIYTSSVNDEVLKIFEQYLRISDSLNDSYYNQKFLKPANVKKLTQLLTSPVNALPTFKVPFSVATSNTVENNKKKKLIDFFEECFPSGNTIFLLGRKEKVNILLSLSKTKNFTDEMLLSAVNVLSANGDFQNVLIDFYGKSKKDEISKKIMASGIIISEDVTDKQLCSLFVSGAIPEFIKMTKTYSAMVKEHGSKENIAATSLDLGLNNLTTKNKKVVLFISTFINGFALYDGVKRAWSDVIGDTVYWNKEKRVKGKMVAFDIEKLNLSFLNSNDKDDMYVMTLREEFSNRLIFFVSKLQKAINDINECCDENHVSFVAPYETVLKGNDCFLSRDGHAIVLIPDNYINQEFFVEILKTTIKAMESSFNDVFDGKMSEYTLEKKFALMFDVVKDKLTIDDMLQVKESDNSTTNNLTNDSELSGGCSNDFKI